MSNLNMHTSRISVMSHMTTTEECQSDEILAVYKGATVLVLNIPHLSSVHLNRSDLIQLVQASLTFMTVMLTISG